MATLYHPDFEHDACGFGLIANLDGRSEHRTVADAVQALNRDPTRYCVANLQVQPVVVPDAFTSSTRQ